MSLPSDPPHRPIVYPQYGARSDARRASFAERPRPAHHKAGQPETEPLLPPLPPASQGRDTTSWRAWWEEACTIASYTVPIFGTGFLEFSLVIATVISIGHLSTTDLAASTLASLTASISGYSLVQGLVSALDSLLPQAWTSGNPQLVGLWSQRMMVVASIAIIPMLSVWQNGEYILLKLGQEPEVARLAGLYLKWSSLELHAYAFNNISRRYYQSIGLAHVPSMIIMVVAPINVVLQYLLVWGPAPIGLGFIGAPIATAISMNLISILSLSYGVFFAPRTAWSPISSNSFKGLGVLVRLGLAGIGQTASEWWSWEIIGLASSFLGPIALASQSVLVVTASTAWQIHNSLSIATSIRIGNLVGAGDSARAGLASRVAFLCGSVLVAITSTIFLVFRNSWALLFNNDVDVVKAVSHIMPLLALFQIFESINSISGGVLRAQGKQFIGAMLNVTAYYVLGIPLGLLLAFRFGMDLHGLWIGGTAALAYAGCVGVWLVMRTDWELEVVRAHERIKVEGKIDDAGEGERVV
ncbi:hypothetical protein BOTBODRAFT_36427 [Botryobasidium botryosum FD-172 SS1]|uniref:MATE efflux family protein n=1 Tax=Botryobasidium botryosum (strain FD-172 SS1) TaxID=930990 RepID=A0A067MFL0_BOTB1|nr:hypothetical protein BOTBODRAFT_36427 [Botryobasidium botryosum FD-172 SS1]